VPKQELSTRAQAESTRLDLPQAEYLRQLLESEQNLPLASIGGLVASLVGAAIWAGVTLTTGYQIGFMAIGVGFLVGFTVRSLGKGITRSFGLLGAALSLLGCAVGNLLAVTAILANAQQIPFGTALAGLDAALIREIMLAYFRPMDLLFYAIAVYYGYRLSFRQLTEAQLNAMLSGGAEG